MVESLLKTARRRRIVASFREDGTHPPRTKLTVETRRVARLFAASMSMPSNPSVAFSYAGPASRIIVAPRKRSALCDVQRILFCAEEFPRFSRTKSPGRGAIWRSESSVTAATSDSPRRLGSALPLAPRVLGTPLVVPMNPVMLTRNPVVVADAARPRVAARRVFTAAMRRADGPVSRASVGSARRITRCAASESEADKTVSALDAILAGSQDDPAPEEVRERVSAPHTHSGCSPFSVSLPCLIREDARYASSHLVFPSARGDAASLLSPSRRSFPKRTRAGSRARGHRPSLDIRQREPSHRLDSFSRHFSNDDRNSPRRRRRANASPAR